MEHLYILQKTDHQRFDQNMQMLDTSKLDPKENQEQPIL